MTTTDLTIFSSFVARHPLAWETFQSLASEANVLFSFATFGFVQDKGAWVLTDTNGGKHAFREFRNAIVALVSPLGNCVFTDGGDVVKI